MAKPSPLQEALAEIGFALSDALVLGMKESPSDLLGFCGVLGSGRSAKIFCWQSDEYASLLAMFHTLAQTGMRKAEVSLPKF